MTKTFVDLRRITKRKLDMLKYLEIFTLPIMFFLFRKNLVWTSEPKLQILRGLLLLIANVCFFYSISIISLAKALTLAFIAPLVVTTFSPFFLGENVGYKRWLAVIIGFFGCATFYIMAMKISSVVSLVCYYRCIQPIIPMLRR